MAAERISSPVAEGNLLSASYAVLFCGNVIATAYSGIPPSPSKPGPAPATGPRSYSLTERRVVRDELASSNWCDLPAHRFGRLACALVQRGGNRSERPRGSPADRGERSRAAVPVPGVRAGG